MHWRANDLEARSPERQEDMEGGVPTSRALRGMSQHGWRPQQRKGLNTAMPLIHSLSLSLTHIGPLQKHVVGTTTTPPQSSPWNTLPFLPLVSISSLPHNTPKIYLQENQSVCRERIPSVGPALCSPSLYRTLNLISKLICKLKLATRQKLIFKNKINHTDEFLNGKYVNMKYLGFAFFFFLK